MNKSEFEEFLHNKIPITKAMGLEVIEFTKSKVKMLAKIEANINDKLTAFGGSINALMTICGWSMVFINVNDVDKDVDIVIKESTIKYKAPIREDFIAECEFNDEQARKDFLEMYTKNKKGRLKLKILIKDDKTIFAEYEGEYVVLKKEKH